MSEPYQIFAFVKDGMAPDEMISTVDRVLRASGGRIEEDCFLILADTKSQAPDPEPIEDANEALARLRAWPTLGSISYVMPESVIDVTFRKDEGADRVHFCEVSILELAVDEGGEEVKGRYLRVARELFERLHATRVIFDWGLDYKGLDWQKELARLQRSDFQGTFELDLREGS
jgi:hypothetical protein